MFDADGDSDVDLFVVSGGNEFSGASKFRTPRLYMNDGKGVFSRSGNFPEIFLNGSCAVTNDFDRDGDLDIFVGGRSVPWKYGVPPDSYLLRNEGSGNFTDVTLQIAPALKEFGFVKDAIWADMDGDGTDDLVIAAEWQPVTIFLNRQGKLMPMPIDGSGLENTNGWWKPSSSGINPQSRGCSKSCSVPPPPSEQPQPGRACRKTTRPLRRTQRSMFCPAI